MYKARKIRIRAKINLMVLYKIVSLIGYSHLPNNPILPGQKKNIRKIAIRLIKNLSLLINLFFFSSEYLSNRIDTNLSILE